MAPGTATQGQGIERPTNHIMEDYRFLLPLQVVLVQEDMKLSGTELDTAFSFSVTLPPWSASVLELTVKPQPSVLVS